MTLQNYNFKVNFPEQFETNIEIFFKIRRVGFAMQNRTNPLTHLPSWKGYAPRGKCCESL